MKTIHSVAPVIAGVLFGAANALPAHAQDATQVMPEIVVEGMSPIPGTVQVSPNAVDGVPPADGGDFLRSVPGIDGVRMGGHGIDPVIRGQQQDQLNVVSDGAFVYGGCPNRMDPPASLSSIQTYDEITVEKGFQSVRHGPGGSGGAVIMERKAPTFAADKPYQVKANGGVASNGEAANATLDIAHEVGAGWARAQATASRASSYKDGKGDDVRSAFKQYSAGLEAGWHANDTLTVSGGYERDRTSDVLFAGTGMDAPYGITDTFRLKADKGFDAGPVEALRFNAYLGMVDHLMDNYSLRPWKTMTMRTPTSSNTAGFKLEGDVNVGDVPVVVGVDYKMLRRMAVRYRGMNTTNVNTIHAMVWPGINERQVGVFGEGTVPLSETTDVKLGLRWDNVHAEAKHADQNARPTNAITRSANDLYTKYYGKSFDPATDNNVSGLIRFDTTFGPETSGYLNVSRNVRSANTTERGMAADHGTAVQIRVGNPDIKPEQHHAIDIGGETKLMGWDVQGSVYYDKVTDFIFRDTARGQNGVLQSDGATIWHNIDATMAGTEVAFGRDFGGWTLDTNLAFTYGENDDTGNPLPQIPPLAVGVDVGYEMSGWTLGLGLNGALKQTRVDDDTNTGSGRDVRQTPAWWTADLSATTELVDGVRLGVGVNNLFDYTYANHLNKSNAFDATEVQVNEPGRSFYLRLNAAF